MVGVHHVKWRQEQKADKEEFGTRFSRPQTPRTGALALQYYSMILQADIFCFLQPAVDQSSRLHYQHRHLEDKGAIYPLNFDTPSLVSKPVQPTLAGHTMHDGDVLHMGNILDATKQEVLEFQPSRYRHKDEGKHLLFCGVHYIYLSVPPSRSRNHRCSNSTCSHTHSISNS